MQLQMQMAKSSIVVFKLDEKIWCSCEEICYIDPRKETDLPAFLCSF